jgi:hypothetical protein
MAASLAACDTNTVDQGPAPTPASMTFKQGARYEFNSYQSDPSTGNKIGATDRTRTWTLVNTSGSVQGRTGVAIYVDSVIAGGSLINLADSVYLQQASGTNDIYRYASLAPDLDFSGTAIVNFDLGKQWMHESRLNATTANWFVGEAADTVTMSNMNVPLLEGIKIAITDSAVGSSADNLTIGGTSYAATKTTHSLRFSISAIINVPIIGNTPVELKSETLARTTWTVPSLGVIAREERQGKVIDVSGGSFSGVAIPSFTIPVPGYSSMMMSVIATGN